MINTEVLKQYNLTFRVIRISPGEKTAEVSTTTSEQDLQAEALARLFITRHELKGHLEDLLESVENALNGLPFYIDGDGAPDFVGTEIYVDKVKIFMDNPTFEFEIPNADLREIILSWFEFLEQNGLE